MPAAPKASRETWIDAALTLIAEGTSPADLQVEDLCRVTRVTKGSFNWHFRLGHLTELRGEVIRRWQQAQAATGQRVRQVQNPLDRLRVLRDDAAANARRDHAMRRWAAGPPAAADAERHLRSQLEDAVAEADRAAEDLLAEALADLGYAGHQAGVLAATLAAAFAAGRDPGRSLAPTNPAAFEVLLDWLTARLPVFPAGIRAAAGGDPDEVILYMTARDLPPPQRRELRETAQRFAEQQRPGREPPQSPAGCVTAG